MKKVLFLIFIATVLLACSNEPKPGNEEPVKFEDLVAMDNVSDVSVWNNKGNHKVVGEDRAELLRKIGKMTLVEDETFKLGGKSITLTLNGKNCTLLTRTNCEYFEISSSWVTKNKALVKGQDFLYFKASELNIDNY